MEIRHSGNRIPKFVPPPPPPTASPFTFTTAASPTTPYYTTVTPYDRPERHREDLDISLRRFFVLYNMHVTS